MADHKHIEQTIVNRRARRDLDAAPSLASIPDNRHRTAARDLAIWQDEPAVILMNVNRKDCTHHGIGGGAKQAFEFRRSGGCDFGTEANAGYVQEPAVVGFADVDWYCVSIHAKRERLLRLGRDPASGSKVIRGSQWHHSQNGP